MSILTKDYEISVWEDRWEDGYLVEKKVCTIGSNSMTSQSRAIDPVLTRNVNGTKKLSFKMYRFYKDNITGEKVDNPFARELFNERKVKLKYDGVWYDFVVKNVVENSSNYLYTYSLEDALVQELSKNGFNTTLDDKLMNNMGDAKELGEKVLAETDWNVGSEVFVQTVDESLVYITLPGAEEIKNYTIYRITDQTAPYDCGVKVTQLEVGERAALAEQTALGFYSCCKNKPHRFQFIYSERGYDKNDEQSISRKDDRTINEKDCQYYIDISNPESVYKNGPLNDPMDLWLPEGFAIGDKPSGDSLLSSWYRGKRYGFAQQAVYVPLLERYCQKFEENSTIELNEDNVTIHHQGGSDGITGVLDLKQPIIFSGTKKSPYSGLRLSVDYHAAKTYILSYELAVTDGTLKNIGGHKWSFNTLMNISIGGMTYTTTEDIYAFDTDITAGTTITVSTKYNKFANENDDWPYIFIQPNRGLDTSVSFNIEKLSLSCDSNYLGYTDTEFVSPTVIQNYISGYTFESTGGWVATATTAQSTDIKPTIENVYGRFFNESFISIVDDFYSGEYSEAKTYTPYMKLDLKNSNQFVLNSGIRDNRTVIQNIAEGEKWILDYKILDSSGEDVSNSFEFSLGEYEYNIHSGVYDEKIGFISFGSAIAPMGENHRVEIEAISSSYTPETFKKNSKIYLKIKPKSINSPEIFYIEAMSLYKKALGSDGLIIVPNGDYESTAEEFVDNSTTVHKHHYFSEWLIDNNNPNKITEKDALPTLTKDVLEYTQFAPVYNEGAKKVRSISAKESNYFNILQNIAETFEAWLELEIDRDASTGAINSKTAKFKNYIGKDNYANFRYGVNLKDIQRTSTSKNIVTKLIVKQNSNELAENGFCTIQRAGANPSGENYIYDFQYYQNIGIMPTEEFLQTNYYLEKDGGVAKAYGGDAELWESKEGGYTDVRFPVTGEEDYSLNGYFLRVKKINQALEPIGQELAELNTDLVQRKAELEVAQATLSAATEGIERVKNDFAALTGVYPEEAQDGRITGVAFSTGDEDNPIEPIVPQQNWWSVTKATAEDSKVSVTINAIANDYEVYPYIKKDQGIAEEDMPASTAIRATKKSPYTGHYLDYAYVDGSTYTLTYEIELVEGIMTTLGGHMASFKNPSISVTTRDGSFKEFRENFDTIISDQFRAGKMYCITVKGTFDSKLAENDKWPWLWIQPNRGMSQEITYIISNVHLYVQETKGELTRDYDRDVSFYLNVNVTIDKKVTIPRTYKVTGVLPAGKSSVTINQLITSVDKDRSDVQNYITEYTTYYEQYERATKEIAGLEPAVANKEASIKALQEKQQRLLGHKTALNNLFFKRYSRFIQEGTWISEEYVDDDKYFADAQSVLYNSCYPQVTYNINVLSLKGIPGYELIDFNLGDKTNAIDEEFFGTDKQVEVVISELSENLDNPDKNSIKVQNFKNQFQDLFQKITATVQQTQYNTGAYEKGNAFLEASSTKQNEFITNALNSASMYLSPNKKHDVVWDDSGITVTDRTTPTNQIRIVGGAILLSKEDEKTQQQVWKTGITCDGISADFITGGQLDVGTVQIRAGKDPVFRWDAYGISAYDAIWSEADDVKIVTGVDSTKFVRFDKYGIYGINKVSDIDGSSWHPNEIKDIDDNATFALTWEGLKVTGNENVVARIGKLDDDIVNITADGKSIFRVGNDGTSEIAGWTISGKTGYNGGFYHDVKAESSERFTHRFGLKIEEGVDNRYAFYVRKFKEDDPAGERPTGDLVFGVKYDGSLKATKGEIAGFKISDSAIMKRIYNKTDDTTYYTFMQAALNTGSTAFTVRKAKGDHTGYNTTVDWEQIFNVDYTGKLLTKNIEATGGKIAGWELNENRLYKTAKNTLDNESYTLELTTDAPNTERIQNVSLSLAGLSLSHETLESVLTLDASLPMPLSVQQNLRWDDNYTNYALKIGTSTSETLENFGIHFYKGTSLEGSIGFDPDGIHIKSNQGGVYLSNIPSQASAQDPFSGKIKYYQPPGTNIKYLILV